MPDLSGSCLCGAVTYTSSAEPLFTAVCHCADCQRQTGTAFSVVVGVPRDGFEVKGELSVHTTLGGDSDLDTHRNFCGACGSPVVSYSDAMPDVAIIKAGTLDDTSWLAPQLEVWHSRAQPWLAGEHERPVFERSIPT
ncbi:MAG: GFA family protein [Thermoleophilaceae bacterium]|nr:GFA family protein [Thermoleophilaceae bacterium]